MLALRELRPTFDAGLAALAPECARGGIELVVACAASRRTLDALRRRHPDATFAGAESETGPDVLRGLGMREASGEIVVILDDCSPVDARLWGILAERLGRDAAQAADATADLAPPATGWDALLARLGVNVAHPAPSRVASATPLAPREPSAATNAVGH